MTSRIAKLLGAALATVWAASAFGQAAPQTLTELELSMLGVQAYLENPAPVVPKAMVSGLRVVVKAGDRELSAEEVRAFLGSHEHPADFQVRAELSGPGLQGTLTLPSANEPANVNVLALALPALVPAGDYRLAHVRLVVGGQARLDVEPAEVPLRVLEQVLVSNVVARPLTLDEIRARGIVLDSDAYLGFEFHIALKLESEEVPFSFPAVFTREGVALPMLLKPPVIPQRVGSPAPAPQLRPVLLRASWEDPEGGASGDLGLPYGDGGQVTIPGLLVIPGDVAYLKQFVAAKLYVANGAPQGSGLSVRDVKATIKLPAGADGEPGSADDPLVLPEILNDGGVPTPQATEMPVLGSQGETELGPLEQGTAEFVLRGEDEGLHRLEFELKAVLEGLASPDGSNPPVDIVGHAIGAVLVRNPFFHLTFTAPSVVRAGEPFKMYATVTNVGQAPAYAFRLRVLDPSGCTLVAHPSNPDERYVDVLKAGDARTFEYRFVSEQTGQVIARYLRLYGSDAQGSHGGLSFTLGVDERGVQLSPDTLQLPSAVETLPPDVVYAAMRVLGQAWSVAKAPYAQLPAGVLRVPESIARLKLLALAEAGLRVQLLGGGAVAQRAALRELLLDFYRLESLEADDPPDLAFDQLLRGTEAGRELVRAIGQHLGEELASPAAALEYEASASEISASGRNFMAFAVSTGDVRAADVALFDSQGHALRVPAAGWAPTADVPSAVFVPLGPAENAPLWGLISAPSGSYVLELSGRQDGAANVSATLPSGDGTSFRRVALTGLALQPGSRTLVAIDPWRPETVLVAQDLDGNGQPDGTPEEVATYSFEAQGPRLLGAAVVGPETFAGASEFGFHTALVFDRAVGEVSAADPQNYALSDNAVVAAKRQLSGRLVFALLRGPEGPYLPQSVSVSGIEDERLHVGPALSVPLQVRLQSPGTMVTGRVLRAGGQAITSGEVYYLNSADPAAGGIAACRSPQTASAALASLPLGPAGYSLHYAKQSVVGCPFYIIFRDPATGARRYASARIQAIGLPLSLDIVLDGVGTVAGQVRNRYTLEPSVGARVVATSNADPQSGAATLTDQDGRYTIPGITVGAVSVRAAKGIGAGFASGHIASAGLTANVDVDLDDGALSIGGQVNRLESGNLTPAVGALVVIRFDGVPLAWRFTDTEGRYDFGGMPAGAFRVSADWEGLRAELPGQAYAGQDIEGHDLVVAVPPPSSGVQDVVGHVFRGDGSPAAEALVWGGGVPAVMTGPDGAFRLPDVPVPGSPNVAVPVQARSADGRRETAGSVQIGVGYQIPDDLELRLPGLGDVVLTVLGPSGAPVGAGVEVKLLGQCASLCGCDTRHTDGDGKVKFEGMLVAQRLDFHTYREAAPTFWDYAETSVTVPADGATGFGVLRFGGFGTVKVKVQDQQHQPVAGSPVSLTARVFRGWAGCTLVNETSLPKTTSLETGEVVFENVLVAGSSYSVRATNPFDPQNANGGGGTLTHAGEVDNVLVTLYDHMSGRLSGQVYGIDGLPVGADVEVTLQGGGIPAYMVKTNADGTYSFSPVLPAGSYTVTALDPRPAQGLGVSRDVVSMPVNQDRTFDLHLKGRGSVRVKVVDGQGIVARAQVKLQETQYPNGSYERPLEVPDEGVVSFDAVYQGPFSIQVQDVFGRGGRASGVLPAAGQTVDVTVRVASTGCVTGRFEMPPDQSPIPNAIVKLLGGPGMYVIGQVTTEAIGDVAGTYAFDYVPLGQVRLQGHDPLTGRNGIAAGALTVESHLTDPQPQCLVLDVAAESLGNVAGTVSLNGDVQPGIEVEVVSGQYRARAASDVGGLYAIEGVPAGQVIATAKPPNGYLAGNATGTLASEGQNLTLDVSLRDSVEVLGHLLRHDGQAAGPVSEIRMTGPSVPSWNPMKTYSNAAGDFHLENVPVGLGQFEADVLQSVDRGSASQDLQRPGPVEVTIQLQGAGRLKGQAQDAAGNPVAGRVELWNAAGTAFANHYFIVGSSGNFVVPELLAGTYTLKLRTTQGSAQLYGTASVTVVPTVDPEDPQDWTVGEVRLEPTGSVIGRVLRADHVTPAYGAEVVVKVTHAQSGTLLSLATQANAQGEFELRGVPLGSLVGTVRDPVSGGLAALPQRALANQGDVIDYQTLDLQEGDFRVVSISPPDGAVNVPVDTPVYVTFNAPLSSWAWVSVQTPNGMLAWGGTLLDEGRTVRLRPYVWGGGPTGNWPHTTTLSVVATSGVIDVFGRPLAVPVTTHFSTPDLTPPVVVTRQPASNTIQVPTNVVVRATFDEPLLAADYSGSMTLKIANVPVAGSVALEQPATLAFTSLAPLPTDVQPTVSVVGAIDLVGNVQTVAHTWLFKTLDTQPPSVSFGSPTPPEGSWVKQSPADLRAIFNDQQSGLNNPTAYMKLGDQELSFSWLYTWIVYHTLSTPLPDGQYTVHAGISDVAGNQGQATRNFGIDSVPPPAPVVNGLPEDGVLHGPVTLTIEASDALSGVLRVELLKDGVVSYNNPTPPYSLSLSLAEGYHTVGVRVTDKAGNIGPATNAEVFMDAVVLAANIQQPLANAVFRDSVTVIANANEPVLSMDLAVEGVPPVTDTSAPYQATFDLATAPEGLVTVTVTAHGQAAETASATRQIRVDRTPPPVPDVTRITAAAPLSGASLVLVIGTPGAVEAGATVLIANLDNAQTAQCLAAADGKFTASILASSGHQLQLVARDAMGNQSGPAQVTVADPPELPPSQGNTRLTFAGLLTDRVGPGLAELTPDTLTDAVFTVSLSIGSGVTRSLAHIDLEGPGGLLRSTRTAAGSVLGVAVDAAAPFLNGASGEVSFPVTEGATLTLIASDVGGFVVPGTTYTATAVFSDGSRFVGTYTLVAPGDLPQAVHSASITADHPTVVGTAPQPGTSLLTLSDLRDIDGLPVPDGARLALAVADLASKDPSGAPIRSAGGMLEGGELAPNNPSFRVFTVQGGQVSAAYSSAPVDPAAVSGALAVVQVLAADGAGNVLGQEAVATYDLNLRRPTDRAVVSLPTLTSVYADKADRRVPVRIELFDENGNLDTSIRNVLVSAAHQASQVGSTYVVSEGGAIVGGAVSPTGSPYRWFTTTTGVVECEYSASSMSVDVGQTEVAVIQVLGATATGARVSMDALGTAALTLTGAAGSEVQLAPESVPLVYPLHFAQVRVHQVRDTRANLLPEGARLLLSAAHQASQVGSTYVASAGGTILEGDTSPTSSIYKSLPLVAGNLVATYSPDGLSAPPGTTLTASIQVLMADPSSKRLSLKAVAVKPLRLMAPTNAVGDADPPSLLADGQLRTSTVTFEPVLDAWGNPLPDGSKVLASAADQVAQTGGTWIRSDGGAVLNGQASPTAGFRILTVDDGAVAATYSSQGVTSTPGQTKTGRVVLLEAGPNGERTSLQALGIVPISLPGLSSAALSSGASSVLLDGVERRVTCTLSEIKDAAGQLVPDGTLVLLTATANASMVGGTWVASYGGTIVGGTASPTAGYKVFAVASGQVVFEYSTSGLAVPTAAQTARVQVLSATPAGARLSYDALATLPLTLTVPGSAVIGFQPADMHADGSDRLSQVTISALTDSSGNPLPDGAKVALTVANNAARTPAGAYIASAGGAVRTAGTTPGDGDSATNNASFKVFTVAGGQVQAVYSAQGLKPGVNESLTARLSVAPASAAGAVVTTTAVATADMSLRGTSSAAASGPATLVGTSGTVTFSAIKDAAGNTVPDGTLVAVTAASCGTRDPLTSACNASVGGTITNGTTSGTRKLFTVTGGAISVDYSPAGATAGTARVQVQPAASDGTLIGNRSLLGGVWAIQVTP